MNTKYGLPHLELMLDFTERTVKIHLMSASKQRRFNELEKIGLMKQDEEGYVHLTAVGIHYLGVIEQRFMEDTVGIVEMRQKQSGKKE